MSKLIPNLEERRKIFYHLKKSSSVTAWNRVLSYYQTWAKIFEDIAIANEDHPNHEGIPYPGTNELISVLKGLSTMEKCLALLRKGDKSPFRYEGMNCFAVANRAVSVWSPAFAKGELLYSPEKIPNWDRQVIAQDNLGTFWARIGRDILQTPSDNDCAPFEFGESDREFFFCGKEYEAHKGRIIPPHHFPADLPEVPVTCSP
jgi:hypothetical protein